jgi:rfaE bifunctional protein nucleotidyltransferase chain/domain
MSSANKILSLADAVRQIANLKQQDKKIVFSNGCFDILHAGHVDYLEKAREKGDFLVIGLNTDTSVRRLKGQNRPINQENSRARVLAGLGFVDMVVLFEEDTPYRLIKALIPDILVKGKDYEISNIVGADIVLGNGGKVETIELTEGQSTTSVIDKIKKITE